MESFPDTPFYDRHKKIKNMYLLSLGEVCYVACAISCDGQFICLHASRYKHDRVGLIDKPSLKSKVL